MRAQLFGGWVVGFVALFAQGARADSWCARPLVVHEWGVHVFGGDGKPLPLIDLPAWFHGSAQPHDPNVPVRALPADSGIRALPVLHFYGVASADQPIPVGVEVGFAGGEASLWYPAVDTLRPALSANSPGARAERAQLVLERAARQPFAVQKVLGPDPTRQLVWDRLELAPTPRSAPMTTDVPWVQKARALGALWVERPRESERFVFYEAATREPEPLVLKRGPTWSPTRRHLIVDNRGRYAVHDVFIVQRAGTTAYVFEIPSIPAGRSAGFVVEDHPLKVDASLVERLRKLLVDPVQSTPGSVTPPGDCVMGRDPAIPFERADGHRLYQAEADLIVDIWGKRFFERPGTTIVYREDTAQLDEAMPLSIYTDMFHHVVMRRLGLALWQDVVLP